MTEQRASHKHWGWFFFFLLEGRYLHALRGVAEQASESDGVGDRTQVDEQDGGQGLDVQRIDKVAGEERQLALDIQDEAAAEPAGGGAS